MSATDSVEWILAGVVGTVDFNGQGFGFILRDKKQAATPIVEYAANDCHDAVTGEHGFTIYRIVLHPFAYSGGTLRCVGRKNLWWHERVENDAKAIISLCCGNLVERARMYIANDLPLEDPELLPTTKDPEHVRAAWMSQYGCAFESLPFRITASRARERYAQPLYNTWHGWPPDRNLTLMHYDGDAESYVEDDPNEIYEWRSRSPGFYVQEDDGEYKEIVGGPFDTHEAATNWAWEEYLADPRDVPH